MNIELVGLSKEFVSGGATTLAAREINLKISDGELFVLLGPSGCGKSTVLNLIAGLEKPSQGEILFDDRLVASTKRNIFLPPRERNVAMVFQSYALYPHMNVFDNIAFPMEIAGERKDLIRKSVESVASMLGLQNLLSARPGDLSGGQRQRVAIARAIVRHPTVFLMDEPLSNLDAQLRTSTRTELKALQQRLGVTTVYVTHDQIEAMSMGDRIAILRDGRLEQVGTPEEIYEKPDNTFVAGFLASPPMNLLNVRLERHGRTCMIRVDDMQLNIPECEESALNGLDPGEWIIGIRPEHIRISPSCDGEGLWGEIKIVEVTGREILVHLRAGRQDATVLTDDRRLAGIRPGDLLKLELNLKEIRIFGPDGNKAGNTP